MWRLCPRKKTLKVLKDGRNDEEMICLKSLEKKISVFKDINSIRFAIDRILEEPNVKEILIAEDWKYFTVEYERT